MHPSIARTGIASDGLDDTLPGGPSRITRALNRLSSPWTAPDRVLRIHRWLYQRTDGRVGHGIIGAPALLLYTTGKRTGRRRCTALCYARDGSRLVIAASNAGADKPPAWLNNLLSNPALGLQVGRRHLGGQARVVDGSDPEYRRLWGLVNASINGRLDVYQARTSRPIPLVALTLTRVAAGAAAR